jgi:hypothetical protein
LPVICFSLKGKMHWRVPSKLISIWWLNDGADGDTRGKKWTCLGLYFNFIC